jgi:hypothetical protein
MQLWKPDRLTFDWSVGLGTLVLLLRVNALVSSELNSLASSIQ